MKAIAATLALFCIPQLQVHGLESTQNMRLRLDSDGDVEVTRIGDEQGQPKEREYLIKCHSMRVTSVKNGTNFVFEGDVNMVSTHFEAKAAHVTFSQKDACFTLVGRNAVLITRKSDKSARTAARRIRFWPNNGRLEVEGLQFAGPRRGQDNSSSVVK